MKFAEKCPKCGGNIQTKSVRKSLGLGFVDIPVAQFCLNPTCDWYQDFAEAKNPEDIHEDVLQIKIPSLKNKAPKTQIPKEQTPKTQASKTQTSKTQTSKTQTPKIQTPKAQIPKTKMQTSKTKSGSAKVKIPQLRVPEGIQKLISQRETRRSLIILGGVVLFSIILPYSISLFTQHPKAAVPDIPVTGTPVINVTQTPIVTAAWTPTIIPVTHPIKMSVGYGFSIKSITINISDTIIWNNDESQRSRIYLVSKDGLFEKHRMQYLDRFSYQFNQPGNYTFALAEYTTLNEYPNTTSYVFVK